MPALAGSQTDVLTTPPNTWPETDYVISFNYRHIIPPSLVEKYQYRMINIHTSVLPWNRGAHPNFWSWYDGTPQGVSIHHIDAGIDTGPLLYRRMVFFEENETLESSYNRLQDEAAKLFCETWPHILSGSIAPHKPKQAGSYHKKSDLDRVFSQFPDGWKTTF